MGFAKFFRLNTLKKRMLLILSVGVLMSLVLVSIVSYGAIRAIQQDRLKASMEIDFDQLSDQMLSEYDSLLQIAQQLLPQGIIGSNVERYLSSRDQYDRIILMRRIYESLSMVTYSTQYSLLAAYIEPEQRKSIFSTFPLRDEFWETEFPAVASTPFVTFHGLHISQSKVSTRDVVSILYPVHFSDDVTRYLYLEASSPFLSSLRELSEKQEITRHLLQADAEGRIVFSTAQEYPPGQRMDFSGEDGTAGPYLWFRRTLPYNFQNILLVSKSEYNREVIFWACGVAMVAVITFLALFATILLLLRLVYRPLQSLRQEIEQIGCGELEATEHNVKLEEFQTLFSSFNHMKRQIASLMDDIREREQTEKRLELDKLYYQINPHFLMNTLHSLHWMAGMAGKTEIAAFIAQLNYILGYSLGKLDRNTTLRTELKVLELYLELQKQRYDFTAHVDVEPGDYLDCSAARLILQPLAENAICHNMDDFGNLWFSVRREGDEAVLTLRDDGTGFVLSSNAPSSRANSGIGLQYVQRSLQSCYGDRAVMDIESVPGQGTTVTLHIPLERRTDDVPGADH